MTNIEPKIILKNKSTYVRTTWKLKNSIFKITLLSKVNYIGVAFLVVQVHIEDNIT